MSGGSNRDLRKYMNDPKTAMAFGKVLSGKSNYMPIIEKRKEVLRCTQCKKVLEGEEKFCPECGAKVEKKAQ